MPRVEVGVQSVSNPDNFEGLGLGNAAIALVDFLEKDIIENLALDISGSAFKCLKLSESRKLTSMNLTSSSTVVNTIEHRITSVTRSTWPRYERYTLLLASNARAAHNKTM